LWRPALILSGLLGWRFGYRLAVNAGDLDGRILLICGLHGALDAIAYGVAGFRRNPGFR
jgi:hypothetical protein